MIRFAFLHLFFSFAEVSRFHFFMQLYLQFFLIANFIYKSIKLGYKKVYIKRKMP